MDGREHAAEAAGRGRQLTERSRGAGHGGGRLEGLVRVDVLQRVVARGWLGVDRRWGCLLRIRVRRGRRPGGIHDGRDLLRGQRRRSFHRLRRGGGLEVGDGRPSGVDQLAHLLLHLGRLRRGGSLRGRVRRRLRSRRDRPVGAERHHHDGAVRDVFGFALAGHEWVLDHRHHAVRAGGDESGLDRVEQVLVHLHAVERGLVERRRHVPGGVVLEPEVGAHAEQEDVAQDRSVRVVADHFSDLRDLAPSVRHPGLVDDEVHRGRDLGAHGFERNVDRGHHDHRLQARKRVASGVGVDGRHRPVMPGVHRLQHVECLGAAHLADQDAVGPHSEAVPEQLADRELALALDVGGAVLQGDDVRVVDLELRCVLDRDHPLVVRDETRDDVQGRRLAGAGAARDEDVHAAQHGGRQELRHRGAQAPLVFEVVDAEDGILELADREGRSVDRGGPDDRVDAAAVGQPGVDHRVETIDVAPGGGDHAADGLEELVLVLEADVRFREHATPLDEDLVGPVDHDLAHRAVVKEAVERSISDRGTKDDVRER